MTYLLEARGVTRVFGGGWFSRNTTVAVKDISLTISAEEPPVIAVVGESGSGKTTLSRLLLGMIPPTEGAVLYEGQDITNMKRDERKRFRREVQAIFQDPFEVYNPFYKVDHMLTTPMSHFNLATSKADAQRQIESALEAVGLQPDETLGRYPHQLSGGQRQRIMVARALLLRPKIILADEPVSMVDASLRATILEGLLRLHRERGIPIFYITHDLTTAYQVADTIMVLFRGSVVEAGSVELVIKDPQHPYTRLLMESIPLPDPERPWRRESRGSISAESFHGTGGCAFADRCPVRLEECDREVPPLYRSSDHRAAACFLYRDNPETTSDEVLGTVPATTSSAEA